MHKILDLTMKFFVGLTLWLTIIAFAKPEWIKLFIEWMRDIILVLGNWNYLVVFMSWLIESFPVLGVIIPWQNILLIAWWFFAEQDTAKLIYVIITASIWAIIWNYIGYFLGRKYWKSFFKKYGLWFWIGETEVAYLEKWIQKWWPLWIVLCKFHNLARAFVPFIAGSMWMKSTKFMFYNIIGSILRAVVIVLLWVLFAKTYETFIDYLEYFFLWIIAITAIYIYLFKKAEFKIYWAQKNKEIEEKMNKK